MEIRAKESQRYLGHLSNNDDPLSYHILFKNGNLLNGTGRIHAPICWVGCDFSGKTTFSPIFCSYADGAGWIFSVTRYGKAGQLSYGFE